MFDWVQNTPLDNVFKALTFLNSLIKFVTLLKESKVLSVLSATFHENWDQICLNL